MEQNRPESAEDKHCGLYASNICPKEYEKEENPYRRLGTNKKALTLRVAEKGKIFPIKEEKC